MTSAEHSSEDCRSMFARLSEYLDGELDEVTCREIRRHAETCVPCEACLETLRRTVQLCREVEDVPVPGDFSQRLKDMVRALARGETP